MKRKTFILLCVILSALFISSCKICVDPPTNPNDPNYNQQEKIDGTYSAKALHYGNIPESYTITIKDEKYNNAKFEKKVLEEDLRFWIRIDNSCEPELVVYQKGTSCYYTITEPYYNTVIQDEPELSTNQPAISYEYYLFETSDKLYFVEMTVEVNENNNGTIIKGQPTLKGYYELAKIEDLLSTKGYYVEESNVGSLFYRNETPSLCVEYEGIFKTKEQISETLEQNNMYSTLDLSKYDDEFFKKYDLIVLSAQIQYGTIVSVEDIKINTENAKVELTLKNISISLIAPEIVAPYHVIVVIKKGLVGDITNLLTTRLY
jgi:hypothetical protein